MANYKKALFLLCSVIALVLVVGMHGGDASARCTPSAGTNCSATVERSGGQGRGVVTASVSSLPQGHTLVASIITLKCFYYESNKI